MTGTVSLIPIECVFRIPTRILNWILNLICSAILSGMMNMIVIATRTLTRNRSRNSIGIQKESANLIERQTTSTSEIPIRKVRVNVIASWNPFVKMTLIAIGNSIELPTSIEIYSARREVSGMTMPNDSRIESSIDSARTKVTGSCSIFRRESRDRMESNMVVPARLS